MSEQDTHSAISVADQIINKAQEQGRSLTPMQVLKLVYLCHGWMLGLYGRPLIDEYVEAWQYGPVIRSLYGAVKKFKSSAVEGPLSVGPEEFLDDEQSIMGQVVEVYKNFSGPQLSELTHAEGTPWSQVWRNGGQYASIPNDLIKSHFQLLAQRASATQKETV